MEGGHLACYAGDVDDGFGGGILALALVVVGGGEEVRDGELSSADWVGEVDVEDGVAVGCWIVFRRQFAGRVPKARKGLCMAESITTVEANGEWRVRSTHRFPDAGTWADNIRASKLSVCNMEHAL